MSTHRRWTTQEEKRVVRQVLAFPQNLSRCFLIVGEEIDRTKGAVENRWYSKLSKDPEVQAFFVASPQHVSINRKNGMGQPSNERIWKRLLRVLGL